MTLKLNGTTSGSVSLDAPATGSNVSFTLPGSVGTSGQLLSTNGSGVLSFVNGGKILQVVRATDTTQRTTTSTSFVDVTGMSVTITPQFSTSTIYVFATVCVSPYRPSGTTNVLSRLAITTSGNTALSGAEDMLYGTGGAAVGSDWYFGVNLIGYHAPSSTSAQTYKLRMKSEVSDTTTRIQNFLSTGQILAIEVAA